MTLREAAKPLVLAIQKGFGLVPRSICVISGAPRSGTSALVRWLGQQPGVAAFEESRILVSIHAFMEAAYRFADLYRDRATIVPLARRLILDYYSRSRTLIGKRLIVDKEPLEPVAFPSRDYGRFIGSVRAVFPESRLLLAVRDPLATIWSMSERTWGESLTKEEANRFTIEEYAQNWCSCADLVLQYRSDPNTYVVQFGRLTNDRVGESRRVLGFLGIRKGTPFEPRQTKGIGFSEEERETILHVVRPRVELLAAQGISDL